MCNNRRAAFEVYALVLSCRACRSGGSGQVEDLSFILADRAFETRNTAKKSVKPADGNIRTSDGVVSNAV